MSAAANLTHEEAAHRASLLAVEEYHLDLDLTRRRRP